MEIVIQLLVLAGIIWYVRRLLKKKPEPIKSQFTLLIKGKKTTVNSSMSNDLQSVDDITLRGIRVNLQTQVPHIIVDSHSNDKGLEGLPFFIDKTQRLELEGDFYESFNLYSPKKTQLYALQIFTPDVMEILVKNGSGYDIELKDRHLKIITKKNVYDKKVQDELRLFAKKLTQQILEQLNGTSWPNVAFPALKLTVTPTMKLSRRAFNGKNTVIAAVFIASYIVVTVLAMNSWQHVNDTPKMLLLGLLDDYLWVTLVLATYIAIFLMDPDRKGQGR